MEIERSTGLNIEGFNCSISAYEIRKIVKDHGNQEKEALRGQKEITETDFLRIPKAIASPRNIYRSSKDYEGKPVIVFEQGTNEKIHVVGVVSDKHLDLFVQTAYMTIKKATYPRRQLNKPLTIRPKRIVVQSPLTVYAK